MWLVGLPRHIRVAHSRFSEVTKRNIGRKCATNMAAPATLTSNSELAASIFQGPPPSEHALALESLSRTQRSMPSIKCEDILP
jgi:hypothetical protein